MFRVWQKSILISCKNWASFLVERRLLVSFTSYSLHCYYHHPKGSHVARLSYLTVEPANGFSFIRCVIGQGLAHWCRQGYIVISAPIWKGPLSGFIYFDQLHALFWLGYSRFPSYALAGLPPAEVPPITSATYYERRS